jgi:hypothetical protein
MKPCVSVMLSLCLLVLPFPGRAITLSVTSGCSTTRATHNSIDDAADFQGLGGGVLSIGYASAPHFEACQFGENTADLAGSLYCLWSGAQLTGCTLDGNLAKAGVGLKTTVPMVIDSCTFSGNTASAGWGGGIPASGSPRATCSTF